MITKEQYNNIKIGDRFELHPSRCAAYNVWTVVRISRAGPVLRNDRLDTTSMSDISLWTALEEPILEEPIVDLI